MFPSLDVASFSPFHVARIKEKAKADDSGGKNTDRKAKEKQRQIEATPEAIKGLVAAQRGHT